MIRLKDKTVEELQKVFLSIMGQCKLYERAMTTLIFDIESGIVALESWIETQSVSLRLKAAGQKAPLAEVSIKKINRACRAMKSGVRARYDYMPPPLHGCGEDPKTCPSGWSCGESKRAIHGEEGGV